MLGDLSKLSKAELRELGAKISQRLDEQGEITAFDRTEIDQLIAEYDRRIRAAHQQVDNAIRELQLVERQLSWEKMRQAGLAAGGKDPVQ